MKQRIPRRKLKSKVQGTLRRMNLRTMNRITSKWQTIRRMNLRRRNRITRTRLKKEKQVKNSLWKDTDRMTNKNRRIRSKKEEHVENTWSWWNNTEEVRNWLDLPEEITVLILQKVGVLDVLINAQMVCYSWYTLCKQPCMYHSIVMRDASAYFGTHGYQPFEDFIKEALNRSCGQTMEFSSEGMITENVIKNLAQQANSLKAIKVQGIPTYSFAKIAQKFPQLEQLEVRNHLLYDLNRFTKMPLIEKVGRFCQKLKYFRLHSDFGPVFNVPESNFDEDAFHIAKHMPQLHHLHLEFNLLTNKGLQAILQGCPSLKYMALQQCSNIALQKNMLKIGAFSRIRNVRVWNESQHHFEFALCTNDEM